MKQITGFALSAFLVISLLFLTIDNIRAAQDKAVVQAYSDFFSMVLAPNEVSYMCLGVHSNVILRIGDKTILFDPSVLTKEDLTSLKNQKIDLVVYTHDHGDHFEKKTVLDLFHGFQPHVAIEPSLASLLKGEIPDEKLIITESGKSYTIGNITVDALKGKHIGPIMLFRVSVSNSKILHAGDSSYIPLETMDSDIVFVPTGYPSPTCSPKKAFKMVADVKPQIAVAFHGENREHKKFEKLVNKNLPDVKVVVPQPYVPQKLAIQ
jgi:L-ascorbate metabolism protein UlaG (beta-lactamase superfamily)